MHGAADRVHGRAAYSRFAFRAAGDLIRVLAEGTVPIQVALAVALLRAASGAYRVALLRRLPGGERLGGYRLVGGRRVGVAGVAGAGGEDR